jgi:hypothetical protein
MSILDWLLGLFGGGAKPDFAAFNPDDFDTYHRALGAIDQAERRGAADLQATLARYGLRDLEHWERVQSSMNDRNGRNPEWALSAARVQFESQVASLTASYPLPSQYTAPPHGISLDRFAAIRARCALGEPMGAVLAAYGIDTARWMEVEQTWSWRMGPQADMTAAQFYNTGYQFLYDQAHAAYGARARAA